MREAGQAVKKRPSERRQKGLIANFRVTAEEHSAIEREADRVGLTFGSYLRKRALHQKITDELKDEPRTRAMRRPVMERVILGKLTAQLGRSGSNLNQIARAMNSGDVVVLDAIQSALAEHRQILAAIIEVLGRKSR